MEPIEIIDPLLEAKEVKRLLRTSLAWVYKAAEQGLIPCVRIPCTANGRKRPKAMIRFKRKDVFDFIENHYRTT